MFGQSSTPFGGGGGGGFGGFGQPQQQPNPFGGVPTSSGPAFGSPPAPGASFGGSGSTAFGNNPSLSGGNAGGLGLFGSPSSSVSNSGSAAFGGGGGAFGSAAPTPSFFGNTVAPAPNPSAPSNTTGMFGASLSSQSLPFGSASSTGGGAFGFGTAPSSGFGSPAAAPTSSGLFGSAPAPFLGSSGGGGGGGGGFFGSTSSIPSSSPALAGSLFGTGALPPSGTGGSGTRSVPFAATARQDGTSTSYLQSITAMPVYEGSSFEELRLQDYSSRSQASTPTAGLHNPAAGTGTSLLGFGGSSSPSSAAPMGGLFGAPAPSAPTIAPSPFSFGSGSTTPAPAGGLFAGSSSFGAPAPAASGLFGSVSGTPATGTNAFGSTTFGAPAPSTGFFGTPAPGPSTPGLSLFGNPPTFTGFGSTPAPAPATTPGLFGNAAGATAPSFGSGNPGPAVSTATPSAFGFPTALAPAPPPSLWGGFGTATPATAPSSFSFGGTATNAAPVATPAFGSGLGGSTGLFGPNATTPTSTSAAPAFSGFGSGSTNIFGAPAASTFWGTTTPATTVPAPPPSLFGGNLVHPNTDGGLFGRPLTSVPANTPLPTTSTLFGASAGMFSQFPHQHQHPPAATAQLEQQQQQQYMMNMMMTAATSPLPNIQIIPPVTNQVLELQLRALQAHKSELEKSMVWQHNSGSSPTTATTPISATLNPSHMFWASDPSAARAVAAPSSSLRSSAAKIRPRGFGTTGASPHRGFTGQSPQRWLTANHPNDNTRSTHTAASPESYWHAANLRLHVRPESMLSGKKPLRLQLSEQQFLSPKTPTTPAIAAPIMTLDEGTRPSLPVPTHTTNLDTSNQPNEVEAASSAPSPKPPSPPPLGNESPQPGHVATPPTSSTPHSVDHGYDYYQKLLGEDTDEDATAGHPTSTTTTTTTSSSSSAAPVLTKPDYQVHPPLTELQAMPDVELAAVSDFSVARPQMGSIEWIGAVDVRDANLDEIVEISHGDISVYAIHETRGTKPREGSKLNRPAILTFYGLFPGKSIDTDAEQSSTELTNADKMRRRLIKSARKTGAEFLSYDANSGVWKIRVFHFSRYKVLSDMEIDTEEDEDSYSRAKFDNGTCLGAAVDVDVIEKSQEFLNGDNNRNNGLPATGLMFQRKTSILNIGSTRRNVLRPFVKPTFDFRGEEVNEECTIDVQSCCSIDELNKVRSSPYLSMVLPLSKTCALRKSSVDFGLNNRRSFRVGWLPNGSFLTVDGAVVVEMKPKRVSSQNSDSIGNELLNIQRTSSVLTLVNSSSCPVFRLPPSSQDPEKIIRALDDMATATQTSKSTSSSFSLLSNILQAESNAQKVVAVHQILVNDLPEEMSGASLKTKDVDNASAAISVATSSANIPLACDIAIGDGLFGLASLLSSGVIQSKMDIRHQLELAALHGNLEKIPLYTLDVLKAISADPVKKMDWRREMALRLIQNPDQTLSNSFSLLLPHVSNNIGLYRVLQMLSGSEDISIAQVVDPKGFSMHPHDWYLPFHLAAAITSVIPSSNASLSLCENLCDSYASQLLCSGEWEWAVFVVLSSIMFGASDVVLHAKCMRAKELVLRNYSVGHPFAERQREFLQRRLGIPWFWFEEAAALRAGSLGDIRACITHTITFDPLSALSMYEELFLPNVFFLHRAVALQAIPVKFRDEYPDSLTAWMYRLFKLECVIFQSSNDNDSGGTPVAEMEKNNERWLLQHSPLYNSASLLEKTLCELRLRNHWNRRLGPKHLLPIDRTQHRVVSLSLLLNLALERIRVAIIHIRDTFRSNESVFVQ